MEAITIAITILVRICESIGSCPSARKLFASPRRRVLRTAGGASPRASRRRSPFAAPAR